MNKLLDAALSRVKQKSTWAGAASLLALVGLKVSPELFNQISVAVIGLIGLYEVVRNETKK